MGFFSSGTSGLPSEISDLTDGDFDNFRKLIYQKSGISLNETKKELLRTRLRARLVREGYKSYSEYFEFVKKDKTGNSIVPLLDDISTNLTSFFREENHFDYLRSVMPEWIARKEKRGDLVFRIWSAGCSTGEEPYSLLFTMLDLLKGKMRNWSIKFLATDLSTEVLKKASGGIYPHGKTDDIPPEFYRSYFEKDEPVKGIEMVRVRPEIRSMISFKRFNLMTAHYPFKQQFDYIFCRNVMIYFDRPTQEALVAKYHQYLKSGGYLFIGHSESLTGLKHDFEYIQPTIYKK
jgi:chemotaxis protein methyltransferase CheR